MHCISVLFLGRMNKMSLNIKNKHKSIFFFCFVLVVLVSQTLEMKHVDSNQLECQSNINIDQT